MWLWQLWGRGRLSRPSCLPGRTGERTSWRGKLATGSQILFRFSRETFIAIISRTGWNLKVSFFVAPDMSLQDGNHHHQFSYLCLPPDVPRQDGGHPLQNPRRPQRNGAHKPSKYTRSPDRQKSFRFVILVLKSDHLDVTIIQHHLSWQDDPGQRSMDMKSFPGDNDSPPNPGWPGPAQHPDQPGCHPACLGLIPLSNSQVIKKKNVSIEM